jgi:photosystem II stability/assembly factor-like uncharacterized protein
MNARAGSRPALATIVIALLVAAIVPALASSRARCANVTTAGSWSAIEAPIEVRAFAVAPDLLYVTDGKTIYTSTDGGCGWRLALTLPSVPNGQFPFAGETITAMTAPSASNVYAAVTGPHVLVSRDGGRTWVTQDSGLAPPGAPVEILASSSDPSVVYLAVDTAAGDDELDNGFTPSTGSRAQVSSLYRSGTAAASWKRVGLPALTARGPRVTGIARGTTPGAAWDLSVSPLSGSLWAATTAGVYASGDGGATWAGVVTNEDVPGIDVRAVEAADSDETAALAIDPRSGTVYSLGSRGWSAADFSGFRTIYSAYGVYPFVWLARSVDGTVLATSPKGAFRRGESARWTDVSPTALGSGAGSLAAVAADPNAREGFYGRLLNGGTRLLHYLPIAAAGSRAGGRGVGIDIDGLAQASGRIGALAAPDPARLSPSRAKVRIAPGESATKTYVLDLPPRPSPLDVYFLLDSTASMSNTIRALARSAALIVSELRADGIDVWAGLGEFRTYPRPGENDYNFPYRRDVDVSPPGRALGRALMEIEGDGNSGSNLTALLQTATGEGQDLLPPAEDIPADAGAHWRTGSLRVVVHAADAPFATPRRGDADVRYPPPTWPGPGFAETIAALRAADIAQVGAAIGYATDEGEGRFGSAPRDLERIARGTGTLAPPGGADCDGDSRPDLAEGVPLVCPIPDGDAGTLPAAIVALLEGVTDVAPVSLLETSRSGVVEEIEPAVYDGVDLHKSHSLEFTVELSCTPAQSGTTTDVDLAALLRDERVAKAGLKVVCKDTPAIVTPGRPSRSEIRAPAVAPPPPALPPPPPPVANPGPAQAPASQSQPQTNPNPNPQPQAQSVVVAQRQQQPQLAFVHAVQDVRQQVQMEYAMSSLDSSRDPLASTKLALGAGALSLILLYGYAAAAARAIRSNGVRR